MCTNILHMSLSRGEVDALHESPRVFPDNEQEPQSNQHDRLQGCQFLTSFLCSLLVNI